MTLSTPIVNAAAAAIAALLMLVGTLQAATPEASSTGDISVERLEREGWAFNHAHD